MAMAIRVKWRREVPIIVGEKEGKTKKRERREHNKGYEIRTNLRRKMVGQGAVKKGCKKERGERSKGKGEVDKKGQAKIQTGR